MQGRIEDFRLITGRGRYVDDIKMDGEVAAVFVRTPFAHGRVTSVDTTEAKASPGVLAVITIADLDADGLPEQPPMAAIKRPDGSELPKMNRPYLVRDMARHLGEPVAMILAETVEAAEAAAELFVVDYDELPAIVAMADALAPGAKPLWPEVPDNIAFAWNGGNREAAEAALAAADHRIKLEFTVSRVFAAPLEPRRCVGYVGEDGRPTLLTSTQKPHLLRNQLAKEVFGLEPTKLRVLAPDIGGAFGLKSGISREEAVVLWAARKFNRPVRWTADRSEAFLGDEHGRAVTIEGEIGLDKDGRFVGIVIDFLSDVGSYFSGRSLSLIRNIGGLAGVYRFPAIAARAYGVFTNTQPIASYRGAGRPEATFAVERLIDKAALELGIDPFELRRRNLVGADEMPYATGLTFTYDCGDFPGNMAAAAKLADIAGFEKRRAEARARGRLRGLGIANPIEVAGGPLKGTPRDTAAVAVSPTGEIDVWWGNLSTGQGHETSMTRLVAERFGVAEGAVHFRQGDTDDLPSGHGSGGSAATVLGGAAIAVATDRVIEAGRAFAADKLGVPIDDVTFADGHFRARSSNYNASLGEIAEAFKAAGRDWKESLAFEAPNVTYPNGCHVCEVEIDPETGAVEMIKYASVEDVGTVLNEQLVDGQIVGGIVQGLGQVLGERIVYDASGQLITGSFQDYYMPRAMEMPVMVSETRSIPTAANPLGAKGVGEAGTVGALSAAMNAICDALKPLGIDNLDMPATPDRVWAAIEAAKKRKAAA